MPVGMANNKKKYTVGDKIGGFLFLGEEDAVKGARQNRRMGKFLCHCGVEFISAIEYVKFGKRSSCGCSEIPLYRPMPEYDDKLYIEFWSRAILTANPDLCWNWTMGKDKDGYGTFNVKYKSVRAHRFAYYLHNKVDPKELQVCHKCDNPTCVNPFHLFLGTTQENTKDRDKKGRHKAPTIEDKNHRSITRPETIKRGSSHWNSKLKESDIISIMKMAGTGKYTYREIGDKFGCPKNYIGEIVRGERWAHISKQNKL